MLLVERLEGPAVAQRIAEVTCHAAAVVQDAQVQALISGNPPRYDEFGHEDQPDEDNRQAERSDEEPPRSHALQVLALRDGPGLPAHEVSSAPGSAARAPARSRKISRRDGSASSKWRTRTFSDRAAVRISCGFAPSARRISK